MRKQPWHARRPLPALARLAWVCALLAVIIPSSPPVNAQSATEPELTVRVQAGHRGVPATFHDGSLYLRARDLLGAMGYQIVFNRREGTLSARGAGNQLEIRPGCPAVLVNGDALELRAPTRMVADNLYLPLDLVDHLFQVSFELEAGPRPGIDLRITPAARAWQPVDPPALRPGTRQDAVVTTPFTLTVNGRQVRLTVVHVAADARLLPRLALAQDRIGGVESLADLARRHGALLAFTGGFFNPRDYARSNRLPTEPWVTLIDQGRVIHLGQFGGVIGFRELYRARIEALRLRVALEADGLHLPGSWVAGVNHTPRNPGDEIYVFTRAYGDVVRLDEGRKVIVRGERVTDVTDVPEVTIPEDGYVLALFGRLEGLAGAAFAPGKRAAYHLHFEDARGCPVAWQPLVAVGAGPILVDDGRVRTDYAEQGFFEPKILSQPARRLAIGIHSDRSLLIVAGDGIRMEELAEAMRRLGARWALNLDGGASAGIWLDGEYLLRPGRELNHALLLVPAP